MEFDRLGIMLDCSRNGVLTVASVKHYMDILSKLGYNCLMLYTEDTFEVDNQPYFGYLRGRYSKAEIKEIDKYALSKGIELIPCIQTLAHLNAIVRWSEYRDFTDINDILLAGDERTYKLIEDIFATLSECFTTRIVHIGMDEAHKVGLGKYLDIHGFEDRTKILTTHLSKVCEISEKYGFKPLIWSDMFFRLAAGGQYYAKDVVFDKSVCDIVPKELGLVYWDYYSADKSHYDSMIKCHQQFNNEIWFAGGLWCWNGFAPRNAFSIDTVNSALPSLKENNIKNAFFTLWGDDGRECSPFAVIPSLFYTACLAKDITDEQQIKDLFYKEFGIAFDDFMLLDLPDTTDCPPRSNHNPEKYMFYNDVFYGIFDCTIDDDFVPRYNECAKKLEKLADNEEYGYLFDAYAKFCKFMQLKYTIGYRTRKAYKENNKVELKNLAENDYANLIILLKDFYTAHKNVWFTDNKPFGFDVQDIRMGGMERRIESSQQRLRLYLNGEIDRIEELEEEILPEFKNKYMYFNKWSTNATVNVITHIG